VDADVGDEENDEADEGAEDEGEEEAVHHRVGQDCFTRDARRDLGAIWAEISDKRDPSMES